jgi:hypothetical protein
MADQCIVCLEDLEAIDSTDLHPLEVAAADQQSTHPSTTTTHEAVALIKPCNHVLHDECLRAWSQKANSCPICRRIFNLVEVLDKVGGMFPLCYISKFHCRTKIRTPSSFAGFFHEADNVLLWREFLLARVVLLGHRSCSDEDQKHVKLYND